MSEFSLIGSSFREFNQTAKQSTRLEEMDENPTDLAWRGYAQGHLERFFDLTNTGESNEFTPK